MLQNIDRAQLIRWVGYYLIVGGILTLCGGILLTGVGGLGGLVSVAGIGANAVAPDAQSGELAAASAGLGLVSTLAVIAGIVNIVLGPAMIIVAVGLFQKRPWARMGVVIVTAVGAIASIVLAFGGNGIWQWVFLIVDAAIVYLFYTDPEIKQQLGG